MPSSLHDSRWTFLFTLGLDADAFRKSEGMDRPVDDSSITPFQPVSRFHGAWNADWTLSG